MNLRLKNRAGLTLIEILVVIAILTILVGLGSLLTPRDLASAQVGAAADELWHNLFWAQALSRSGYRNLPSGIHFGTTSYTIFTDDVYSASEPTNIVYSLPNSVRISSVDLSSGGNTIYFREITGEPENSTGTISYSGDISLIHSDGYDLSINVSDQGVITLSP